jgi:prepilin peptidase CpaA
LKRLFPAETGPGGHKQKQENKMPMMQQTILYPLAVLLLISSIFDIRFQRIPNWITFGAMAAGLCVNTFLAGTDGLAQSAGGIVLGTGIFLIPYTMGGMGAGDAKLMGAVGAFLGVKGVFVAALFTMVTGGVYAIVMMLWHWQYGKEILLSVKDNIASLALTRRLTPSSTPTHAQAAGRPRLCYGVAIAGGTFLYMIMESSGYRFL